MINTPSLYPVKINSLYSYSVYTLTMTADLFIIF